MNERRARERSGHPQLGVQRRAARRVRRCGGRRRGASAGETVVVAWSPGGDWGLGRIGCDAEVRAERSLGFGLNRRGSDQRQRAGGDPATLSSSRSNAEIYGKKIHVSRWG